MNRASDTTVLVVAKAPVPGLAKTRLMRSMSAEEAADIAAGAVLDTLSAVASISDVHHVVALTGDLGVAARSAEIRSALGDFTVIGQRGDTFAERLVHAHADAFRGGPIVQIGMDTPQVDPGDLVDAANIVAADADSCVLGPAEDGGWWMLAVPRPEPVEALASVPMSRDDTGERSADALAQRGLTVVRARTLRDADELSDLELVAAQCRPGSEFAAAVSRLRAS